MFAFFYLCRCYPGGERRVVHTEAATMLCALWLHAGSTQWPEMEGGETSRSQRNGGVCHTEQGGHYRCYISRSHSYGK